MFRTGASWNMTRNSNVNSSKVVDMSRRANIAGSALWGFRLVGTLPTFRQHAPSFRRHFADIELASVAASIRKVAPLRGISKVAGFVLGMIWGRCFADMMLPRAKCSRLVLGHLLHSPRADNAKVGNSPLRTLSRSHSDARHAPTDSCPTNCHSRQSGASHTHTQTIPRYHGPRPGGNDMIRQTRHVALPEDAPDGARVFKAAFPPRSKNVPSAIL